MGKFSRDKGSRYERELVTWFLLAGIHAERVPDSGASGYNGAKHDIDAYCWGRDEAPLILEAKRRKSLPKFITDLMANNECVVMREDNGKNLFVLDEAAMLRFLRAVK